MTKLAKFTDEQRGGRSAMLPMLLRPTRSPIPNSTPSSTN